MRRNLTDEEIEIYFSMKLSDSLPENELAFLNKLIEEDPELKARWLEFCEHFREEDIDNSFAKLDDPGLWSASKIIEQTEVRSNLRPLTIFSTYPKSSIAAVIAAAAAVTLLVLVYYTSPMRGTNPRLAINSKSVQFNDVYLVLSDGERIDLGADQKKFRDYLKSEAPGGHELNRLVVPPGKNYELTLHDGSVLQVNSNTTVDLPGSFAAKREIWINGEAYVKVAKDARRMFIVHTQSGDIQVLGTEFNVNTYDPGHTKVSLVSGAVRIATAKKRMMLRPGSTAVTSDNKDIVLKETNVYGELAWKDGQYYFRDSDLKEIKEVLERWYGTEIRVTNPDLMKLRFTGKVIKDDDIQVFLENLSAVTDIKYKQDAGIVILK
jgi:transmembrane sensor